MDAEIYSPLSIVLLSDRCVKRVHAHVLKRINRCKPGEFLYPIKALQMWMHSKCFSVRADCVAKRAGTVNRLVGRPHCKMHSEITPIATKTNV